MHTAINRPDVDSRMDQGLGPAGPGEWGEDAASVGRRAAVFARELGAVGDVGRLLAKRAAVLAGRMERLADRDEVLVAANVAAARDAFDADRRAERVAWADALDGEDPDRIGEALANLELSGQGLDLLHRLWGRLLEGVRSDDPAATEAASRRARRWIDAMGTGTPGDAGDLATRVAAEVARLRARDARTRAALERMMADARHEAGVAAAFDPSPEAVLARRHEAAAERGFFRALKLIRDLRRDAGLAPVAEAEARVPMPAPDPIPIPAERPARPATPPAALGSFRAGPDFPPTSPEAPLASFRVGADPAGRRRPDLARVGGKRR